MTATLTGVCLTVIGTLTSWSALREAGVIWIGLLAVSGTYVWARPALGLTRTVERTKAEKGSPITVSLEITNGSRRRLAPILANQTIGPSRIQIELPGLDRAASVSQSYPLPTQDRGVFTLEPVEIVRADPFGFWRSVHRLGTPVQIEIHPRCISLAPIGFGNSNVTEGPTSDASPHGSIAFHRLRPYVVGDDLRSVHWPSTARCGELVVRQNVDTAQQSCVVLLDVDPTSYQPRLFELAVDIAASVIVSNARASSQVELRTSAGARVGGVSRRNPQALIDFLTNLEPLTRPGASGGDDEAKRSPSQRASNLTNELTAMRQQRGGSTAVVITGSPGAEVVGPLGSLRGRFDRVILISVEEGEAPTIRSSGVIPIQASNLESFALLWNRIAAPSSALSIR